MYDLEEPRIIEEIKKRNVQRVLLQLPEGMKKEAQRLSNLIQEKTQASVIVSGEPCWGACDLPIDEAKKVNADLIIHFGHAPFHKPEVPVLYIEMRYKKDVSSFIKKNMSIVKQYKKIALVASVQHVHQLPHVKELLEQEGMQVTIPKAMGRVHHAGQILGCEYSGPKMVEEDIDAYLALTNQFHALGLKLSTVKPLWMFDPVLERVENLQETREKMLRKRIMMVEKAKDARSFGILISTKSGQINKDLAENLKKKIESHQKEAMVITMKEIQPDELLNFATVDVFVSTACPRVAVEDQPRFGKPIITTVELLVALGEISWDELLKKGFITAPYGAT